jgi:hypothetical protein
MMQLNMGKFGTDCSIDPLFDHSRVKCHKEDTRPQANGHSGQDGKAAFFASPDVSPGYFEQHPHRI